MLMAFIHGMILAFGLILPLGPQNTFIFNQGAVQTRLVKALPAVITAGICDSILILIAISGVSLVILKFSTIKIMLVVVGVLFLAYMGWLTWHSGSVTNGQLAQRFTTKKQILFTMSVSLLNPHAILDTIGVIGINSLQYSSGERFWFTSATIMTSFLWFFTLILVGRLVRQMGEHTVMIINKVAAVIMWGSALYLAFTLL